MKWIIGIDEVGRGPIAGPVTVCAVAMPYKEYKKARWQIGNTALTDSKKLSKLQREKWYAKAKEMEKEGKIKIAISSQTAAQIDRKGISVCIKMCVAKNLTELKLKPKDVQILLDGGLKAPAEYIAQKTVIKGDQKHKIISLASVVAKVTRDAYMVNMAKKYPGYGWNVNMGYGTKMHRQALKNLYIARLHRQSFLSRILDIR